MTSQMTLSVGMVQAGSRKAVSGSGSSSMSDSLIFWKPRIEDPSKPMPSVNSSSENSSTGMEKCCHKPGRSMNLKSTILTWRSLAWVSTCLGAVLGSAILGPVAMAIVSHTPSGVTRTHALTPSRGVYDDVGCAPSATQTVSRLRIPRNDFPGRQRRLTPCAVPDVDRPDLCTVPKLAVSWSRGDVLAATLANDPQGSAARAVGLVACDSSCGLYHPLYGGQVRPAARLSEWPAPWA